MWLPSNGGSANSCACVESIGFLSFSSMAGRTIYMLIEERGERGLTTKLASNVPKQRSYHGQYTHARVHFSGWKIVVDSLMMKILAF